MVQLVPVVDPKEALNVIKFQFHYGSISSC